MIKKIKKVYRKPEITNVGKMIRMTMGSQSAGSDGGASQQYNPPQP